MPFLWKIKWLALPCMLSPYRLLFSTKKPLLISFIWKIDFHWYIPPWINKFNQKSKLYHKNTHPITNPTTFNQSTERVYLSVALRIHVFFGTDLIVFNLSTASTRCETLYSILWQHPRSNSAPMVNGIYFYASSA